MRQLTLFFALIALCLTLIGCESTRQKYNYRPPESKQGARCVDRCYFARNSCEQICLLKNPRCYERAVSAGKRKFTAYQDEQLNNGLRVTKRLKDFIDTRSCTSGCTCTKTFNTCYSACGGEVRPVN